MLSLVAGGPWTCVALFNPFDANLFVPSKADEGDVFHTALAEPGFFAVRLPLQSEVLECLPGP